MQKNFWLHLALIVSWSGAQIITAAPTHKFQKKNNSQTIKQNTALVSSLTNDTAQITQQSQLPALKKNKIQRRRNPQIVVVNSPELQEYEPTSGFRFVNPGFGSDLDFNPTAKDHRYERESGTNDLSSPNVELREGFDMEQTTPRPTQTDQHHEYFVNH